MSRVIKASMARFTARRVITRSPSTPEPPPKPVEAEGDKKRAESPEADVRAAYDDLIATAKDEVSSMLREARDDTQALLRDAEKQAADLRRDGYEKGYREGLQQAKDDAMDILSKAEQDATGLAEAARVEHDRLIHEAEPQILRLAFEVAEKILNYKLETDNSAYLSILSNALGSVKAESSVSLKVNPSDYVRYFNSRETAKLKSANGIISASVSVDSAVDAGGCFIETEFGSINSSPAAQVAQIANSLGLTAIDN